jgi:menaquinone-dependent protoporphyrinogen IX oxidase
MEVEVKSKRDLVIGASIIYAHLQTELSSVQQRTEILFQQESSMLLP